MASSLSGHPMSGDPQRNATSFFVCYHAARLGHTIDPKRVDDATVPITDVIVCWTCQTFTDIARGRGREETSGISGWSASLPRPGPKPEPQHLRNGASMFSGDWGGCCVSGVVLAWTCSLGSLFQVHLLARFQATGGSRFWTEYEPV